VESSSADGAGRKGVTTIFKPNAVTIAVIYLLLVGITGCTVSKFATPVEGKDVTTVQPGSTREQLEALLGACIREWNSETGILYCMYEFDAGYPGDKASAALWAVLDVMSLGLFELYPAIGVYPEDPTEGQHLKSRIIVSYDNDGNVLGVFDEFAVLPDDGKSVKRQIDE